MGTLTDLPKPLREAVTREMQGERIHWVGRASTRRTFFATLPVLLFAIPWTAFAIGWEAMAVQAWFSGKPPPTAHHALFGVVFVLFGLPFVAVGFYMMWMPFSAARQARRTVHVVGDRRYLAVTVGRRRLSVKSHDLATILRTERTERRDGTGTLTVVTGAHVDSDGDRVETREVLVGIPDVRKVEQVIAARRQAA